MKTPWQESRSYWWAAVVVRIILFFMFPFFLWLFFFYIFQLLQSGGGVNRVFCSQSTWARTVDKSRLAKTCFVSRPGVISLLWKLGGKMCFLPFLEQPVLQHCNAVSRLNTSVHLIREKQLIRRSNILCREMRTLDGSTELMYGLHLTGRNDHPLTYL